MISKYAGKILLLVPHEPRALNFEALKKCIGKCDVPILECEVGEVFKPGWNCAYAGAGETIVSTGSIYLAGEFSPLCRGCRPTDCRTESNCSVAKSARDRSARCAFTQISAEKSAPACLGYAGSFFQFSHRKNLPIFLLSWQVKFSELYS